MEVVGMVADTASSSGKGVRYGAFGGGGLTALVVEVLLGVGRFDVDRGAEMAIFDTDIDVTYPITTHAYCKSMNLIYYLKCTECNALSYTNYLTPRQTTSAVSLKLHTNLSSKYDTTPVSISVNPPTFHPRLGGT